LSRFRDKPKPSRSDWLGLGEASRLLGVAPGTLRRWSDAGRIKSFTTPGGHRRYRRAMLDRLVPSDKAWRPPLAGSDITTTRLARAYRAEARRARRELPWLTGLTDEQRTWFREHGRLLAESLVAYLDALDDETAQEHLGAATAEAGIYGRMAAGLGISLSQTVEGFLQFRRPFLHQLALFAERRGLDATATTGLMETTERAMDRLLVAAMNAFSLDRVGELLRLAGSDGVATS
jgi:excisionase family DNA binding protein